MEQRLGLALSKLACGWTPYPVAPCGTLWLLLLQVGGLIVAGEGQHMLNWGSEWQQLQLRYLRLCCAVLCCAALRSRSGDWDWGTESQIET